MRIFVRLIRLRLALLNGIAAVGGHLLFPAPVALAPLTAVFAGVTLLAAAGSAFNQVLERDIDRLMARTQFRPLPAGELTPGKATAIGCACLLAGLALLGTVGGWLPAFFGGAALAWYLGLYTPLKRRTSLALAIGAICGAIPPLIGWCSAGGNPSDYRVVLLASLLFLWQIPHFWLLQRRHIDDYRRAGIPLIHIRMNGASPVGLCRLWLAALVVGSLLLPAFGIIAHPLAFWYAAIPLVLGILTLSRSETALVSSLNLFPLMVTLALLIQR